MYIYDFYIAGLLLRVCSRYELKDLRELSSFRQADSTQKTPDAKYQIESLPADWAVCGERMLTQRQSAVYRWNGQLHQYFYWSGRKDRYVLLVWQADNPTDYTIYIQDEDRERLLDQFRLSAFLGMEWLLLHYNAFQLHASVIEWRGRGILFTAPSGTGKSTQAQLWHDIEGAEIINGDRGILRRDDGRYRVYGSPYAGTSGIYVNQSAPVGAIVVLSQGQEDRLERLRPTNAFRKLYRESTVASWDAGFVETLTARLMELIGDVPVYHLACRPDEGAVETLKTELKTLW